MKCLWIAAYEILHNLILHASFKIYIPYLRNVAAEKVRIVQYDHQTVCNNT
jgi:hypothetical protein